MRILLDMDCVLVDFVGGIAAKFGTTTAELEKLWEPGTWDCLPALRKLLGMNDTWGYTELWNKVDTVEFWESLQPLPWHAELVKLLERTAPRNWFVVSTPTRSLTSHVGKINWLKLYFGNRFDRFHLTKYKEHLANPTTVLIDEKEDNIRRFCEAGGHGILFPAHNNSLFAQKHNPMEYLTCTLSALAQTLRSGASLSSSKANGTNCQGLKAATDPWFTYQNPSSSPTNNHGKGS